MLSRRNVLSLAVVFASQLCILGAAAAQTPPADQPAAAPAAPAPAAPAAEPEKKEVVEEIIVTGSRLRRKDLTTPAPVTVISHDQIMASGKITIAEFLQILPEQGNSLNQNANNGGDGTTTVNLRGLDSQRGARTLVLLNGRRMITGGPGANNFVDLGTIPSSAIERIEVLKDGASAIYGSDAIAGVVNLITRKGFNGTEAVANWGITSRGDGNTLDLALSTGSVGERTSSFLSINYYGQKEVTSGSRSFATNALSFDYTTRTQIAGGSGSLPTPRMYPGANRNTTFGLDPASLLYQLINACPTHGTTAGTGSGCPSSYILDPNASGAYAGLGWRPYADPLYNFAAVNAMVTPQQRIGLFGFADARLGSNARVYAEGSYVNRQNDTFLAPEPMWGTVYYGLRMSAGSQYNIFDASTPAPAGTAAVDVDFRRRLMEADRRHEIRENDTFRGVGGVDGTLPDVFGPLKGWFWDLSFNFGRDVGSDTFHGNLNLNQIRAAIGPSFNGVCYATWDPALGKVQAAYSNPIAGCVPLNMFAAPGTITQDQVNALTFAGPSKGTNQQAIASATLSGDLFRIMSDRPVGLALGFEYRDYLGENIPDPFTVFGYTSGQQSAPIKGSYNVKDFYGELSIPLVSGMDFVDDLEVSVAGRTFKYNLFGRDQTYKLGARYRPIRDVTLRGTYATAFRAPSISELFGGTGLSADVAMDPCDDFVGLTPAQQQRCLDLGVVAGGAGYGQTQLTAVIGSNGGLQPEKAKTLTLGVVLEPRWVKNLSVTVDYYDVKITSPIARDFAQIIVNSCVIGMNDAACARITRDPTDGGFIQVDDLLYNQGKDEAAGVDVALRYQLPTEFGRFGLLVDSTFLIKRDQTKSASLGGVVVHGKNTYDLGVNPGVKFNAGVQYFYANANAGLLARYIGGYKECAATLSQQSASGGGNSSGTDCVYAGALYHNVPSVTTVEGNVGYTFASSFGKTTFGVGVSNIFDKDPPVLYSNITQWSDWNYDFLGRRYYFRMVHTY